jgi:hypothetical protein
VKEAPLARPRDSAGDERMQALASPTRQQIIAQGEGMDGIEIFTREIEAVEVGDDHLSTPTKLRKFPATTLARARSLLNLGDHCLGFVLAATVKDENPNASCPTE